MASKSHSADISPKSLAPGRPKDLGKRAAILEAARKLFLTQGFERVSMDQIASEAGVSKLTVYSHFGDKDSLFGEAVRAHCEQGMPTSLFNEQADTPLRERPIGHGEAMMKPVLEGRTLQSLLPAAGECVLEIGIAGSVLGSRPTARARGLCRLAGTPDQGRRA